ncbi:MAG: Protein-arginine kinase activator protein [Opitutia bacterium UBA7350]|nr:MAG: Protein-arginine kinase activator protein [Opitutae bacterium UBA7350]
MGNVLKCKFCDEVATVHLTQIINNKIHKVDLCENCAQNKGVSDSEGYSLAEMLMQTNIPADQDELQAQCQSCGYGTSDFRRTGRMGCSECYTTFEPLLEPILEDMHSGLKHIGKVPAFALNRQSFLTQMNNLKVSLARAIESEAYEEAAQYRDKIQALESELQKEKSSSS